MFSNNAAAGGGGKKSKKKRPAKKRQKTSHEHQHDSNTQRPSPPSPPRQRSAPSEAALALSATLKDLSSRKRLKEALALYHDPANDGIRDGHHGSILVDCCSRCGDVVSGERIVAEMEASGVHVSVQAKTALLKGYAHSGQMKKGAELYRDMCASAGRDRRDQPNVRTLNTLLRGCLWTAASLSYLAADNGKDDPACVVAGGVATSEEAWKLSKDIPAIVFDASSFEYSIALLCQALRCDEAKQRLNEMKQALNTSADGSTLESIAASSLHLARAYALLGKNDEAHENAKACVRAINESTATGSNAADIGTSSSAMGGKRSWKQSASGGTGGEGSRRSTSNFLFRSHRSTEMKNEAEEICAICTNTDTSIDATSLLPKLIASRLLYFSGGGTTDLTATIGHKAIRSEDANATEQLMLSAWLSFGLASAVGRRISAATLDSSSSVLTKADRKALRAAGINPAKSVLSEDGTIDFRKVFKDGSSDASKNRPINIELGAGSGDWIRMQAIAKPEEDYVSVELRSDRVAQTFAKLMLSRAGADGGIIDNVCSIGAECGSFLRDRVPNQSVSTIYVNHPEPPTQSYGSCEMDIKTVLSGSEPAHMLNSETLKSAAECLLPNGGGRLVIITDNKWYGMLLCKTFERLLLGNKKILTQINLEPRDGFHCAESGMVRLFEGSPNSAIGHVTPADGSGSSYFDRLWRTGAGAHAERRKRYAIVMRTHREGDGAATPSRQRGSNMASSDGHRKYSDAFNKKQKSSKNAGGKKKPNKKKSLAKQQRRNERRLAKKQQQQQSQGGK